MVTIATHTNAGTHTILTDTHKYINTDTFAVTQTQRKDEEKQEPYPRRRPLLISNINIPMTMR
jgi:hypothetical protein